MMPYSVTTDGFLHMEVLDEDYEFAEAAAQEMGCLRNSIRQGEGNVTGFLGEALVKRAFSVGSNNTYNFDLTFNDEEGLATFEVKTKDRTAPPLLHYQASVAAFNTKQQADFYVFVSLYRPKGQTRFTQGYICGLMPKDEFLQRAAFRRKGELDPTDSRAWPIKADCYNIDYAELYRFGEWAVAEAA